MDRNRADITAAALDAQGAGVAEVDGLELHVADLLPGERAIASIDHRSPHRPVAWGEVLRRIGDPSPDRVAPGCPAFGRCGGCAWQHLAYPAQLIAKRARVAAAFSSEPALSAAEILPVIAAPSVWGYRNKGKYVVGGASGRVVLGAYAPRTHTVVETLGCKVVEPVIDEVATWAAGAAQAAGLQPYQESTRAGHLRYVVIRANRDGDVLAGLVVPSADHVRRVAPLGAALARHPAVRSVLALINARRDGSIAPVGAKVIPLAGDAKLTEWIGEVPISVGVGEFLQVNRRQADALYAMVAELAALAPGDRAIDLYCGVGGIALALARAGARVEAVERNGEAAAALRDVAQREALPIEVRHEDAATAALAPGAAAVVVNPPRRGLSPQAVDAVAALGATRVIYVSCGPETLAADLRGLGAAGYTVERVQPFDLMPGTAQVETVVSLRRG
ncbi:MAG: 23S rRNA (uracil(1939)-C(5))-methyltransferase RlmD [Kofleriaceae bacterium]